MSLDNQEQQKTDKEIEDAALAAAMAEDDFDAPVPETQKPTEKPAQESVAKDDEQPPTAEEGGDAETVEPVEIIPGYTAEKLTEMLSVIPKLQQTLDKTNGTHGQKFQELSQQIASIQQLGKDAGLSKAQIAEITADHFAETNKEFPGLSESLTKDLTKILSGHIKAEVDPSKIDEVVNQRISALKNEYEEKEIQRGVRYLNKHHSDWKEVATYNKDPETGILTWNNHEFGNWVVQQSDEIKRAVVNSNDAYELADILSDYKQSLNKDEPEVKQTKPSALKKAVQPKSVPGNVGKSEKDLEEEAFRKAMMGEDDF